MQLVQFHGAVLQDVEQLLSGCLHLGGIGQVVAAARLEAPPGEWRSNAARGGRATAHRPSQREAMLATAAASALRLGHCGVDLVPAAEGPLVLEVNPTPGFLRLEEATSTDVAGALVRSTVRLARPSP